MFTDLVRHARTHVVGYVALFVALAGTSYAGITAQADKGDGGKIYACVTNNFGTLNLTGPDHTCPNGQRLISWNEEGPEGDPGPQGERGKRGKRGRLGLTGATGPQGPAGDTSGSVTRVETGLGLTGGPITNTGTIAADPSVLQRRVTGSCSGNEAAQTVAEAGTISCTPFVKQIAAGAGLSGGTITNSGTVSVDPAQTQSRVGGSCGGAQAMQGVNQNGTVSCSTSLTTGTGSVLSSGVNVISNGAEVTLLQANGFAVVLDCTNGTNAVIRIRALPGTAGNVWATGNSLPFTVAGGVDGNAAPPNNSVVIGTTLGDDRGDYDIGVSTGPLAAETLAGSFAAFKFGPGCIGQATAIAS